MSEITLENLSENIDVLSGANLEGAYLPGANLTGANLRDANLAIADLTGADLTYANLSGADLPGANLSGANLSGADLALAKIFGANLSDANLTRANLPFVYLTDANLEGANLSDANLAFAYLEGANLEGAIGLMREGMPDPQELRLRVADHIEQHPELHNQNAWGDGSADPFCGTPCCVAGWACHLGGGSYGLTVATAATILLWIDGKPMPSFKGYSTRDQILAALRA
ncbi:MAG: pentapeptide repeat-containing protein [Nitrososphaera sp.]|nr:pentapeptide repeat-containing protein [Nitrososphaera sp.]